VCLKSWRKEKRFHDWMWAALDLQPSDLHSNAYRSLPGSQVFFPRWFLQNIQFFIPLYTELVSEQFSKCNALIQCGSRVPFRRRHWEHLPPPPLPLSLAFPLVLWINSWILYNYVCTTFYITILLAFLFHISIIISKSSSVNFCVDSIEIFIK